MRAILLTPVAFTLGGCATLGSGLSYPAEMFFADLNTLCTRSFTGRVTVNEPNDPTFDGQPLMIRSEGCTGDQVRIALDVGEDRSWTWSVSRTKVGLVLDHVHRNKSGEVLPISNYGGVTTTRGTRTRQEFPADARTKAKFVAEQRAGSLANVWAMEIVPGTSFTYELRSPDRLFRATFDLSRPIG